VCESVMLGIVLRSNWH